jgi:hypothetical protein
VFIHELIAHVIQARPTMAASTRSILNGLGYIGRADMTASDTTTVAAQDVACYRAPHRMPTCVHLSVHVPLRRETPSTRHECSLETALCEQVGRWPRCTAMAIAYRPGGDVQYLPSCTGRRSSLRSANPTRNNSSSLSLEGVSIPRR